MHEHLPRHIESAPMASERSFGLVFALFFLLLALQPLASGHHVRIWALFTSGTFLLTALTVPARLAPLNQLWMKFGQLLHGIVSPLILFILFLVVIAPTGLIMRMLGKDLLRLRLDKSAPTYWIDRTPPGPSAESLNNQF